MVRTPYQVALRLYALAEIRWAEIDAEYIHVDLLSLPAHRFLNVIWYWALQRVPPDKHDQWLRELEAPLDPTQAAKPTERQIEDEGASFMAAMQMHKEVARGR